MNLAAKQFDLGNAQTCARASLVAYGRSDFRIDINEQVQTVSVPATDTHCIVVKLVDCVIIAFRGTDSIRDWITDAEFLRTLLSDHPDVGRAEVHSGFLKAFESILGQLSDMLKQFPNGTPIFVTGHSLGGALALLCAFEMRRQSYNVQQVYTFGQPRVGNAAFKKLYEAALGAQTFRVVYQEDIVPRVPHLPSVTDPYRHCGQEVFIPSLCGERSKMSLVFNPPFWRLLVSDAWGLYRAFIVFKFAGALDPVRDHFITNYTYALEEVAP